MRPDLALFTIGVKWVRAERRIPLCKAKSCPDATLWPSGWEGFDGGVMGGLVAGAGFEPATFRL